MTITHAMVLAAGLGTRMRPITDQIPKPLVRVAGKPMIDYALDLLAEAGVRRAVVNVHHFADQMVDHLKNYSRLDIVVSDERAALMNSGGGLAKGLKLLDRSPVLVMNADLFWIENETAAKTNLQRLGDAFDAARMDMLMLCADPARATGHNGKNDFNLAPDGRLTRFKAGDPHPVIYAGALVMQPGLLDDAPADAFNLNIYFDRAIAAGRLYGIGLDGHWLTVGTPDAIGEAEEVIARLASDV
ncbi:nucleotidyltransferase family protein [Rhizobium sp. CG5]|uniref:nucleotidyltransferase family protein n=1 Tax=Rhizobium sp. CG5 TaxID=2726076 RepID=UPI0020341A53|nr:nucleotidyltransferase family protein [Rhizobium sp. CG5]MCM2476699.1 nucleotidyltransferase family protein [Rhizobium sp. CG5]